MAIRATTTLTLSSNTSSLTVEIVPNQHKHALCIDAVKEPTGYGHGEEPGSEIQIQVSLEEFVAWANAVICAARASAPMKEPTGNPT